MERPGGSHTDYHAFWINPKDPRTVWVGHDGGIDRATTAATAGTYHNDMPVGQFYQVSADMRRPYYVCGGLQDNNAWCGPSALRSTTGPVNTDWFRWPAATVSTRGRIPPIGRLCTPNRRMAR